ncbi:cytochrome P450 2A4 [Microcaecilia unicolor]|uniref:Cytochrome P450 2A4-like n=1 Tax=Microcaecilia unicolor TaxID=1415580 RepID=A0A6P7ZBD2_9AMPH|nr:cytochrome P450 2A4-like [Microcaecilia unicolor]
MFLLEATTIILGVCVFTLILLSLKKDVPGQRQDLRLPPGPIPLPLIGNLLIQLNARRLLRSLLKLREKFGSIYMIHLGPRPIVVLSGYQVLKEALVDKKEEFGARGKIPLAEYILQGYGITVSNGERSKQLRRFVLMTLRNFGMGKRSIEKRIQEEAHFLVEALRKTNRLPFDPTFFFSQSVSNIICSVVFGNRFDYEDQKYLSLLKNINEVLRFMNSTLGLIFACFPRIMKCLPGPHHGRMRNLVELKDFVTEKIKVHQETLDPNSPRDFIDCFLKKMGEEKENPETQFYIENLVGSTVNLFFAGTETVSTTLRYGFLILLKYPKVEEKIHEEIERVIGRERCPSMEDRSRMPYTDAVIHEVQRFADIIPTGLPHSVTQDVQLQGYCIPKDTDVFPMLTTALHDPEQFSDPVHFNPNHFLNENGTFKKKEAFLPFSTGKRVCLGEGLARMELFLFLTTILQNFTLKPTGDAENIDLTPELSTVGHLPQAYTLCMLPR